MQSHRSAATGEEGLTAGLSEGREVDGLQAWGGQAGVEQEAGGHTGLRTVAGRGAVVTAGGLQLPGRVWAGAGQADSTAAAFVRGADGGGGAGGDAAAAGNAASHGGGDLVCFGSSERKIRFLRCKYLLWLCGSYILSLVGCWPNQKAASFCLCQSFHKDSLITLAFSCSLRVPALIKVIMFSTHRLVIFVTR